MEMTLLKNFGPKSCWLRLNTGEFVCIPARQNRQVNAARLERNPAFEKLCKRGVLGKVEAPEVPAVDTEETSVGADASTGERRKAADEEAVIVPEPEAEVIVPEPEAEVIVPEPEVAVTEPEPDDDEAGKAGKAPGKRPRGARKPPRA